jgi:hypothetical protein
MNSREDTAEDAGAALAVLPVAFPVAFPAAFPAARAASYERRRMGAHSYDVRSVVALRHTDPQP